MGKIKITEAQYKILIEGFNNSQIIKEDVTDQECIDKLQDDDGKKYKVVPLSSYEVTSGECNTNPNIKCIVELLTNAGVDESDIAVNKISGSCYVLFKSKKKIQVYGKTESKYYLTFWDDGDFVLTRTLSTGHKKGDDVFIKLMNEGEFTCDNTGGVYSDLSYTAGVDIDGKKHSGVDFTILKRDGTKSSYRSGTLLKGESLGGNGKLSELIKKIY